MLAMACVWAATEPRCGNQIFTKLIRFGFSEMVDDREMLVRMLRQLKDERITP